MGRRHLAIGSVVVGALGWQVWGGEGSVDAREQITPEAPVAVRTSVVAPGARPVLEIEEVLAVAGDPDAEPIDADGLTIDERWAGTVAELEDRLARDRGAVQGRVRELVTSEPLPGVTVALTSRTASEIGVAITDGDGFYTLPDLAPGDYLATFYLADLTYERSVTVRAREATPVFVSLIQPVDRDHREDRMPDKDELARQGISFTGVESQNNTYYVDGIELAGLTFGDPESTVTDELSVSTVGVTTVDNQYVIDGVTIETTYTRTIPIAIDETDAFQETR